MSLLEIKIFEEKRDLSLIESYCLPDEQAIYTTLPTHVVDAFRADPYNQPYVMYVESDLIGCFVLYGDSSGNIYTANENAILLKSLSIDSRHQNKGYALQTLNQLPSLVKTRYPDNDEILLTVHHTNTPAIHLYMKTGFTDKGMRYAGEYGEELIFHYGLV